MTTYASEPGTRLGGRYRLEDRIAAGGGWDAWKAIDETLARAVTVFTLAPGFPRTTEVVTAARAASRLSDPRIAQVFDVEDSWQRPYIVMEWAAGETLGDMLSQGPLEPDRGARMIAEAAAALATAHGAGVAHMCLSPGSVRWSPTGEVKVVGLGIDAALSGVTADNPVLTDTIGLGKLLYSALTGYWPGPDYPALNAAPTADGLPLAPRKVLAGVSAMLSDLTCQAMQLPVRGGEPVTSPDQLARALLAAIPPPPVPPALPPRRPEPRRQADVDYWPGSERDYPRGRGDASGQSRSGWDAPTSWDQGSDWARPGRAGPGPGQGSVGRRGRDEGRGRARSDDWADPDGLPGGPSAIAGGMSSSGYGGPPRWRDADGPAPGSAGYGGTRAPGGRPARPGRPGGPGTGARSGRSRAGSGARGSRPGQPGTGPLSRLGGTPLGRIPPRGMVAAGVAVAAIAVLAIALWPGGGRSPTTAASRPSNSPTAAAVALVPAGATGFDPLTSAKQDPGDEQSAYAKYAIDGNPKTAWQSQWYKTAQFGGLKAGSGLMLDMGRPVQAQLVTLTLSPRPGSSVELLVGNSDARSAANLNSMRIVASATNVSGTITLRISHPASGRYLVIWFTALPPKPGSGHWYMAQVSAVTVRGVA